MSGAGMVCHCVSSLEIGGVERNLVEALPVLQAADPERRHLLLAFGDGPLRERMERDLAAAGVGFHIVPKTGRWRQARAIRALLLGLDPEIVHAYTPGAGLWARFFACTMRARIIRHYRGIGSVGTGRKRLLERLQLLVTDAVLFNSRATQAVYNHHLRLRLPQRVVPNAIVLPPPALLDHDIARYGGGRFELLSLSRVVPIKGIDLQIRALRLLRDQGHDMALTVVGDGASLPELKALASELGLAEFVRFPGHTLEPHGWYPKAHCFLATSYNETFCISLVEAMAHGLACIAPTVGGPAEIVRDGVDGYLLEPTDPVPSAILKRLQPLVYNAAREAVTPPRAVAPAALAERILYVRNRFATDAPMREAARQRVRAVYTMDRFARDLRRVYDDLAAGTLGSDWPSPPAAGSTEPNPAPAPTTGTEAGTAPAPATGSTTGTGTGTGTEAVGEPEADPAARREDDAAC